MIYIYDPPTPTAMETPSTRTICIHPHSCGIGCGKPVAEAARVSIPRRRSSRSWGCGGRMAAAIYLQRNQSINQSKSSKSHASTREATSQHDHTGSKPRVAKQRRLEGLRASRASISLRDGRMLREREPRGICGRRYGGGR